MANTSNYLSQSWNELIRESKQQPSLPFLLIALLTLPFNYAVNGIAVGLFVLVSLITFKKRNFRLQRPLVYPVLLYLLMALSVTWTHDQEGTIRALSKTLPLLLMPFCFMVLPAYTAAHKSLVGRFYSLGIVGWVVFYLVKAVLRFVETSDTGVFFYHELVTEDVNAIHVSVYVTLAFFWFFAKQQKKWADWLILVMLAGFILLLSSKNIIFVLLLLVLFYELIFFTVTPKIKWITVFLMAFLTITLVFSGSIRDRFLIEFRSNDEEGTVYKDFGNGVKVYNVSVKQAWEKERFEQNEYFPGAAFRVYQFRIFLEMLEEDDIFFTGYGLNATDFRIEQKGIEHNIFLGDDKHDGYQTKNFHNQYVQFFAELGIFGLILLLLMLLANLKNALRSKDFVHFCFAILMISLFLTESFLARQRGVVFFSLLYCLYNSGMLNRNTLKN